MRWMAQKTCAQPNRMCYKTLWKVGRIEGWGRANSGELDPEHLRQKLCIPLGCAENVLAGLEEKGIIEDDRVF